MKPDPNGLRHTEDGAPGMEKGGKERKGNKENKEQRRGEHISVVRAYPNEINLQCKFVPLIRRIPIIRTNTLDA